LTPVTAGLRPQTAQASGRPPRWLRLPARYRSWRRREAAWLVAIVMVGAAGLLVLRLPSAGEGVLNGSAAVDLSGWRAASDAGPVTLTRVPITNGPSGVSTAVDVRRAAGRGRWTVVLADLRTPETFFQKGHTYRMQAYVRDVRASGYSAGIHLANSNFAHRPTETSQYGRYTDDSWHLLQRTFVATHPARSDTALYFDLPTAGRLWWQITLASVREVTLPTPPRVSGDPSTVLSFEGEEGAAPDDRVWSHEVGGNGWGNEELQTYTESTSNAHLNGQGALVLTARREDATGPDGIPRHYTSARLSTVDKFTIPPGSYIESSIRAPTGEGVRPAFWLLGANLSDVGWPACGELDIMEGTQRSVSLVRQTMHFPRVSNLSEDSPYGEYDPGGYTSLGAPRDAASHRYGVYFDSEVVQFYVDRKPRLRLTKQEAFERHRTWPFGQPQHVVLNIAIGGDPGETKFPVSMEVGKISIWRGGVPSRERPQGRVPWPSSEN
jgi:Glycosyl hydrolases family 16